MCIHKRFGAAARLIISLFSQLCIYCKCKVELNSIWTENLFKPEANVLFIDVDIKIWLNGKFKDIY